MDPLNVVKKHSGHFLFSYFYCLWLFLSISLYFFVLIFSFSKEEKISREDRETIARLRNCILALTDHRMLIFDSSLDFAVKASLPYSVVSSGWVSTETFQLFRTISTENKKFLNIFLRHSNIFSRNSDLKDSCKLTTLFFKNIM